MAICKIGETKLIGGKLMRKERAIKICAGCYYDNEVCSIPGEYPNDMPKDPIESGGKECEGSIWVPADEKPESQWKPIETAPRDGSHCLIWREDIVFSGYWSGFNGGSWIINAPGLPAIDPPPTHWMPRPEPPPCS